MILNGNIIFKYIQRYDFINRFNEMPIKAEGIKDTN
jgi:hypothetical protein